jgi:hypothetical protein
MHRLEQDDGLAIAECLQYEGDYLVEGKAEQFSACCHLASLH